MENIVDQRLEQLKLKNLDAYNDLMNSCNEGSAKKGEFLVEINSICKYIYVLNSGIVKQFRYKEDGTEFIIWFGLEREVVTGFTSFVTQQPSRDGVEVLENCEYLVFSRDKLYQLAAKYHAVETFLRELIELNYILSEERLFFLQALTAKQKYDYIFKNMSQLIQRISQKELASFLGITRETLSRIRKFY